MNLNKEEEMLINLLTDRIKENPYDKEARCLLGKIKETDKKIIKNDELTKEGEYARKIIRVFYDRGVIPTIDAKLLTENDANRMADFLVLCFKIDEINKELYKTINKKKFKDFEEFEPYIMEYAKEIVRMTDEMRKIKERII